MARFWRTSADGASCRKLGGRRQYIVQNLKCQFVRIAAVMAIISKTILE